MGRRSNGAASARKSRKKLGRHKKPGPPRKSRRKPLPHKKSGPPKGRPATGRPFGTNDPRINRKGRPPSGQAYAEMIRELAEAKDVDTRDGRKITRRRAVVDKLYSKAIQDGDLVAMKYLIEKSDGAPSGAEVAEGGALVQIFAYIRTAIFRATMDQPEVRARIVKQVEAAIPVDAEEA